MQTQNEELFSGDEVIEIVENQLEAYDPPRVKETVMRLILSGITREEAVEYIACALCVELEDVVNNGATFDHERYVKHLDALPDMPWVEEEI